MRYFLPIFMIASPIMSEPFTAQVRGDFDGDGMDDIAMLIETAEGGEADLIVSHSRRSDPVITRQLVWVGGIGQQPELVLTEHKSLQIISQNISIGRNRWEQTHTIAYREGALRLAGFTYSWYDTLNLEDIGTCDLNLLSKRGVITLGQDSTEEMIIVATPSYPLSQLSADMPAECEEVLN